MIEFDAENDIANFHNVYFTQQHTCCIEHRQHRRVAAANLMYNLSQFHIRGYTQIITLDDRIQIHQCQYSMVSMMRQQFPLTGQTGTIDTMRFEDDDGEIGTDADNHQRHEHRITTRQFCNQEDTCQRGVHHTRHHTSHPQQGEILLRHINTNLVDIPQT